MRQSARLAESGVAPGEDTRLPTPDSRLATRTAQLLAVCVGCMLVATAASAQINSDQIRQRYQKNTSGTSIDDFIKKLSSEDAEKRLEGVKQLGATRDPKAVEYLIQALGDSDVRVRVKSVESLGEMRATDATQVLIQHLFLRSTEPQMKQRILASLGKIGDARAAQPIMELLHRDLDPATRGTAIFALGDIGAAESAPTLEQLTKDESDATVRRLASEALNKVQHHQAAMQKEANRPTDVFLPKAPEEKTR